MAWLSLEELKNRFENRVKQLDTRLRGIDRGANSAELARHQNTDFELRAARERLSRINAKLAERQGSTK